MQILHMTTIWLTFANHTHKTINQPEQQNPHLDIFKCKAKNWIACSQCHQYKFAHGVTRSSKLKII